MRHPDATRLLTLVVAVVLPLQMAACGNDSATPAAQSLPNMGKQITPLAPAGAQFVGVEPRPDRQPGLAGRPGGLHRREPGQEDPAGPDERLQPRLPDEPRDGILQPDAMGTYFNWPDSMEYVFVYDISTNTPVQKQVVKIPNTYNGIAFDPSGTAFYVSSGVGDGPFDSTGAVNPAQSAGDNVHVFTLDAATGTWAQTDQLLLDHTAGNGLDVQPPTGEQLQPNEKVAVSPCAAGVAVSDDGKTLVVANYYNDSITVFTGGLGNWSAGHGARPAPRQERPREGRGAGRRVPVLGGREGQRGGCRRVRLEHPRPRDRRREPVRDDAQR